MKILNSFSSISSVKMVNGQVVESSQGAEKTLYEGYSNVSKLSRILLIDILVGILLIVIWAFVIVQKDITSSIEILLILADITFLWILTFIYFLSSLLKHKNNRYVVTDKHIILFQNGYHFDTMSISNITRINLSHEDGIYGDLVFITDSNELLNIMGEKITFTGVENPRKVIELVTSINNTIQVDKPSMNQQVG